MAKEREEPYVMDDMKLIHEGHIPITKEHSVKKDKHCWVLHHRPEYKLNKTGDKENFTSTQDTFHPTLEALVKGMSEDTLYFACVKYKKDLKELAAILKEHKRQVQSIVYILKESDANKQQQKTTKKVKNTVVEKSDDLDDDIP